MIVVQLEKEEKPMSRCVETLYWINQTKITI